MWRARYEMEFFFYCITFSYIFFFNNFRPSRHGSTHICARLVPKSRTSRKISAMVNISGFFMNKKKFKISEFFFFFSNLKNIFFRSQAHVVVGGHLRRDFAKARQGQDEVPQNCQCQQGFGLHCQQRSQIGLHRRRR